MPDLGLQVWVFVLSTIFLYRRYGSQVIQSFLSQDIYHEEHVHLKQWFGG